MKYIIFSFFLALSVLVGCSSCLETKYTYMGSDSYKQSLVQERAERDFIKYITLRTVKVIVKCNLINTKDKSIYRKSFDCSKGTGTIIYSSPTYSLVQTAKHVVNYKPKVLGTLELRPLGYVIEKYNIFNKKTHEIKNKIKIAAMDDKEDLAVLKVPYNFKVNTKFAKKIYLGQSIRVIGFPYLILFNKTNLSYEKGYIATFNIEGDSRVRYGVAGYLGMSGGAVFNQQGELVGMVTGMSGIGTANVFIPFQNGVYGPGIKTIIAFYKKYLKDEADKILK